MYRVLLNQKYSKKGWPQVCSFTKRLELVQKKLKKSCETQGLVPCGEEVKCLNLDLELTRLKGNQELGQISHFYIQDSCMKK